MLFHEIQLRNLLSFGPTGLTLPLRPLNVLIGPNASGKSNLIEAFSLLQSAPRLLASPVRDGGGIGDWLWKGRAPRRPISRSLWKTPRATCVCGMDWTLRKQPNDSI